MHVFLKLKIKKLASDAKATREAERHILTKGRALLGKYNKSHAKGQPHPAEPDYVARAKKWMTEHTTEGVFNDEAQQAVDKAYEKFWGLQRYRTLTLRREARNSLLAYGFLRGKSYAEIESNGCYELPDFNQVKRMAEKFCEDDLRVIRQRWAEWLEDAVKALAGGDTALKDHLIKTAA